MKKNYRPTMILPIIILIIFTVRAFAQWPTDPDSNLLICDHSGEQIIPKIAATSDGGCYVCWYDYSSGNYDVYMQRLNGNGEIQWSPGGMLISNHPQDTWLTDYDMTVDDNDHAVVVFNDIRAGGDWDIYAYRISPNGDFVWGGNGLTLSDNENFEVDPVVTVTSSGNFVFVWQDEVSVYLRKVNPLGTDMWSPTTINLTSTYGMMAPRVAPAEDDGVIVSVMQASGPNFWDPKHLYAHKFDSLGVAQWDSAGVAITIAGGIAGYMSYGLASDEKGGAYSFWYDDRDMTLNAYVQHILSDSTVAWTANGVQVSLAAGELQMDPWLVNFPATEEVMVFYLATDFNQTLNGIHGQKLDSLGALQWGSNGTVFVTMTNQTRSHISAQPQTDGAIIVYKEFPVDNTVHSYIKAIKVDMDGSPVWTTSPVDMCSYLSDKVRVPTTVNESGMVIAAWDEVRFTYERDIYLQNINPDGTLGPTPIGRCCYNNNQNCVDTTEARCLDLGGDWDEALNCRDNRCGIGRCCYNDNQNCVDTTEAACLDLGGDWDEALNCIDNPCPTGCDYVVGDVNGSVSYNGLDITYGVAFFKGGSDPLCPDCPVGDCNTWHYCGDVNGSCSYNGLDITYGVAYFKGGPDPMFCADCPPAE